MDTNLDNFFTEKINENIPNDEEVYDLADFFKMFSDSTRLKILCLLCEKNMCVIDIANMINMSQSAVSHQLRVLKQSKLLKYKRDGKNILYSLADNHITTIINNGLEHIQE